VFVRPDRDNLARLAELVDAGSLTVAIARTFALDDIVEAYRFAETGHPRGKVLVTL
jgi:NADPH:quinone reductase-like Zn-dependent oxidoreductase